jgi:hypothetical protein
VSADREGRAQARQLEQLVDLRVLAVAEREREAEARLLRPAAGGEQDGERGRVDELRVAEVDDYVPSLVEQDAELRFEPFRRVRVVLAHQRDDSRWRISEARVTEIDAMLVSGKRSRRQNGCGSSWGNLPVPPDPFHRSASRTDAARLLLRTAAKLLCLRAALFFLQTALFGCGCRLGRDPLPLDPERPPELLDEALESELPVSRLAPLVLGDGPQERAGTADDAALLRLVSAAEDSTSNTASTLVSDFCAC